MSTTTSTASITIPVSDTGGSATESKPHKATRSRARIAHSLVGKLVVITAILVAVPAILYFEFRAADSEKQQLLLRSVQEQGRLITGALRPVLAREDAVPIPELGKILESLAGGNSTIKLLLRPSDVQEAEKFYYVASSPVVPNASLQAEREHLLRQGILSRLDASCVGNFPDVLRFAVPTGKEEVITSLNPVRTKRGCWAIVVSHATTDFLSTSLGQPYWQTPEVRSAAAIYAVMAFLILGFFVSLWRNLRRFATLAGDIRRRGDARESFVTQNTVPELAGVAVEVDRMVETLQNSAKSMRVAAEDNAHAFQTPIAVIRQSIEPLKRIVPEAHPRGRRALQMIEISLDRLARLVASTRRMEEANADYIDPPSDTVDLAALLGKLLNGYYELFAARGVRLNTQIDDPAFVQGSEDLLGTAIENVVENAVGFAPDRSEVSVSLRRSGGRIELSVEDSGPGVAPVDLERVFERYYSGRKTGQLNGAGEDGHNHFGIGLWIVRRNVEAVGGEVRAENRDTGGFRVRMRFPATD
jgi:two-component system sensor histidine kinase ChvG